MNYPLNFWEDHKLDHFLKDLIPLIFWNKTQSWWKYGGPRWWWWYWRRWNPRWRWWSTKKVAEVLAVDCVHLSDGFVAKLCGLLRYISVWCGLSFAVRFCAWHVSFIRIKMRGNRRFFNWRWAGPTSLQLGETFFRSRHYKPRNKLGHH